MAKSPIRKEMNKYSKREETGVWRKRKQNYCRQKESDQSKLNLLFRNFRLVLYNGLTIFTKVWNLESCFGSFDSLFLKKKYCIKLLQNREIIIITKSNIIEQMHNWKKATTPAQNQNENLPERIITYTLDSILKTKLISLIDVFSKYYIHLVTFVKTF